MDSLLSRGQGFLVALEPSKPLFASIGVLPGNAVGVLTGVGPALTVALLPPVTFKLDPAGSLIMFAGCPRIPRMGQIG
jgi:putative tricarboxylic transport membrane protein